MNTIGNIFRLTSFGESHGNSIGGVIDGIPAGIEIDLSRIQEELNRRRPGQSSLTTARNESDRIEILSGIFENKTLGTPIGFIVRNKDHRSEDYSLIKDAFRPSHADYTYQQKYGLRDYRGGGRSSARETIARVVAGAFAKQVLAIEGINIVAYTSQVGDIKLTDDDLVDFSEIEKNMVRCPNKGKASEMIDLIEQVKRDGDTIGGVISCVIDGVPAGLGAPVFGKLSAELARAMMSINAAKGFEIGAGFNFTSRRGSEVADEFVIENNFIRTKTNHSGGVQGGISTGMPITFNVVFKPVATLLKPQKTINTFGEEIVLEPKGRHDPCVVSRAVPIVEAMAAITILDAWLQNKTVHFK